MEKVSEEMAVKRMNYIFHKFKQRYGTAWTHINKEADEAEDLRLSWLAVIKGTPGHCLRYSMEWLNSPQNVKYMEFAPNPYAYRLLALDYVKWKLPNAKEVIKRLISKDYQISIIEEFSKTVDMSEIRTLDRVGVYKFSDQYDAYIRSQYTDITLDDMTHPVEKIKETILSTSDKPVAAHEIAQKYLNDIRVKLAQNGAYSRVVTHDA